MNHTEHYQLSQWDKTDRILMDDFNADNAKIEAALASEAAARQAAVALHPSAELLAGRTVDAAARKVELDISQVVWDRYFLLLAEVETAVPQHLYLGLGLSGESCTFFRTGHSLNNYIAIGFQCSRLALAIPVLYNGNRKPLVFTFANSIDKTYTSLSAGGAEAPLSSAKKFIAINETDFAPGDVVKLWGVK